MLSTMLVLVACAHPLVSLLNRTIVEFQTCSLHYNLYNHKVHASGHILYIYIERERYRYRCTIVRRRLSERWSKSRDLFTDTGQTCVLLRTVCEVQNNRMIVAISNSSSSSSSSSSILHAKCYFHEVHAKYALRCMTV